MMKKQFIGFTLFFLLMNWGLAVAVEAAPTSTDTTQQTAIAFSDLPQTHANYVAIMFLAGQNVLSGYPDKTFKPDQLVNRAEALKIILQGTAVPVEKSVSKTGFKDVKNSDWFAPYVVKAKELGIVSGNPDGTFTPTRNVARADYLKMLLMANGFKSEGWADKQVYGDVPTDAWFAPYMNYGAQVGLLPKDESGLMHPTQELSRGNVAQILYLLTVLLNGANTEFLLGQAQNNILQIDVYLSVQQFALAKTSAQLAVDTTQQALKNLPDDRIVLGAAKIARAYDFFVNAYLYGVQNNTAEAKAWAEQAITKATEAWQANNAIQPMAKHIKDLANGVLDQIKN